jgi:hypothetical protein
MALILINQTSTDRFYLSGTIDLPPNGTYTAIVTNVFQLAKDSFLIYDCIFGNVSLSDGANIYMGSDARDLLGNIASSVGGAVVGYIGTTAPPYSISVSGVNPSGNVQPATIGTLGDLQTNTKTILTPASPTFATVGVSSGSAVNLNTNRKGLILTNTSSNTISLGFSGNAAVLNSGITLYPGWIWIMDEFNFTTNAIAAIASGASSNLAIQEFNT